MSSLSRVQPAHHHSSPFLAATPTPIPKHPQTIPSAYLWPPSKISPMSCGVKYSPISASTPFSAFPSPAVYTRPPPLSSTTHYLPPAQRSVNSYAPSSPDQYSRTIFGQFPSIWPNPPLRRFRPWISSSKPRQTTLDFNTHYIWMEPN